MKKLIVCLAVVICGLFISCGAPDGHYYRVAGTDKFYDVYQGNYVLHHLRVVYWPRGTSTSTSDDAQFITEDGHLITISGTCFIVEEGVRYGLVEDSYHWGERFKDNWDGAFIGGDGHNSGKVSSLEDKSPTKSVGFGQ